MGPDFYDSSMLSLILSWVVSIPMFIGFIQVVMFVFQKHEDVPWLYSAWIGLCFLVLGPLRYEAFLVALAASYPWQNLDAFFSILWVLPWIPALIAFAILNAVGVIIPIWVTTAIADSKAYLSTGRVILSAIVAPIAAYLGTVIFFLVLPFAGRSAYFLNSDAILRATNGPADLLPEISTSQN